MDAELKPCPFCGSKNLEVQVENFRESNEQWYVECLGCGMVSHKEYPSEKAIAAWNTRVPPKAAPLVWEGNDDDDDPKAFLSKNPDVFFICYETMGVGYRALLKCGVEIVWDECGFGTIDKARAACQSCADALAFKLVTGKEPK